MSEQPLISIIVPVYNAQSYLSNCIDSLIGQSYKNLEIIFVNDGSTDNSLNVLKKYKEKDSRILIIDKKNAGVSAARNDGMKVSSGQYVMFVDSDDWIDTVTCEKAISTLLEKKADIVMWSYVSESENRSAKKEIFIGEHVFEGDSIKEKLHRRFIGLVDEELEHPELADSLCPVWGKLYRKDLISEIAFVDLNKIGTYEDGLFNLFVFEKPNKVVYLPEYFYHYRRSTTESVTSGYRKRLFEQWQTLFTVMRNYIKAKKLPDIYKTALDNRIALSILGLGLNEISSKKSIFGKIKELKRIISLPEFRSAYKNLNYSYFPIHWKVFYKFARYRFSFGVYLLLLSINKIIH